MESSAGEEERTLKLSSSLYFWSQERSSVWISSFKGAFKKTDRMRREASQISSQRISADALRESSWSITWKSLFFLRNFW